MRSQCASARADPSTHTQSGLTVVYDPRLPVRVFIERSMESGTHRVSHPAKVIFGSIIFQIAIVSFRKHEYPSLSQFSATV